MYGKTRRERPKRAPYLRLKNIQGTTLETFGKFFSKKVFFSKKSGTMRKNSKIGLLVSIKVFTNRKLQKNARGYPLIEFKSFRKKSHSAEKSQRGGAFGLASTFGSINKFVVKCENRTHDLLLLRKLVEQMNKRL